MTRINVISNLTDMMANIQLDHPVRVGIDGVDASGKTMLAEELADSLRTKDRAVIKISIDDFHNPRDIRYQQGRDSPQGYYDDSFNYSAVITNVLEPLGPGGDLKYKSEFFDLTSNSEVESPFRHANPRSVLILEGIFLHRPELRKHWDFSVFIHSDFEITCKRAQMRERDLIMFKKSEKVKEMYTQRYIPGQQIYLNQASPLTQANVVWNNNDIDNPYLVVNESANKFI